MTDITSAGLLAQHLSWASQSESTRNRDFNVVTGDVFRWKWMCFLLADYFGIEAQSFDGIVRPLEGRVKSAAQTWADVAEQHQLTKPRIDKLASWWRTDADLGRTMAVMADMGKSRKAGFLDYQNMPDAFFSLFARLDAERIIPKRG